MAKVPAEAWIISHRPFNSINIDSRPARTRSNRVQELAFGPSCRAAWMSVAGHLHFFQAVTSEARPPPVDRSSGGVLVLGVAVRRAGERRRLGIQQGGQLGDLFGLRLHGVGPPRRGVDRHAVRCRGPADQALPAVRPRVDLRVVTAVCGSENLAEARFFPGVRRPGRTWPATRRKNRPRAPRRAAVPSA